MGKPELYYSFVIVKSDSKDRFAFEINAVLMNFLFNFFLKDHVKLKTGVMMLKNWLYISEIM